MKIKEKYNIVFKKLDKLVNNNKKGKLSNAEEQDRANLSIPKKEFDEIDELRRLSETLAETQPRFFTQT